MRGIAGRSMHLGLRCCLPLRSQLFDLYIAISPEGDQRVFHRPEMKAMFLDDLVRGTRTHFEAPILDLVLFTRTLGLLVGRHPRAHSLLAR